IGKRPYTGKRVVNICRGQAGARKQPIRTIQQIADLIGSCRCLSGVICVRNLGGADQDLTVPGNNKDRPSIDRLSVESRVGRILEARQYEVRSPDSADQWAARWDA